MRRIGSFARHLGWALVALAAMLIILWFLLNLVATKTPAPVSTAGQWVGTQASGSTYGF